MTNLSLMNVGLTKFWVRKLTCLVALVLVTTACGSSVVGTVESVPQVHHVYVTWPTGGGWRTDVPDRVANSALSKLEAASGGKLVFHRQEVGTPMIKIRLDDHVSESGARGLAWAGAPCSGEIAVEGTALGDDFVLLHELGHIFIAEPHSPHCGDVMLAGGTLCPNGRPLTYSAREVAMLQQNLAGGCTRTSTWN